MKLIVLTNCLYCAISVAASKPRIALFRVENSGLQLKVAVSCRNFRFWQKSSGHSRKFLVSSGKFQAMLLDNNPANFRCRQVVVLRHAAPGPEFSRIIFAVWQTVYTGSHLSHPCETMKQDSTFCLKSHIPPPLPPLHAMLIFLGYFYVRSLFSYLLFPPVFLFPSYFAYFFPPFSIQYFSQLVTRCPRWIFFLSRG